jgi:two-component system, cell cycle response regulator DivK
MTGPKDWTVLVIDDEQRHCDVLEKALSFEGATVYTALNGQEGLEALTNVAPTFILLDLQMPVMSGWDMFRYLQDHPEFCKIPVIALSANAMAKDRALALEMGFVGYILKPFYLQDLFQDIQRYLGQPVS